MNIAYSCNEAYIQHTGISMISLFENNKEAQEINLYFIPKDVSENSIILLKGICDMYCRNFLVVPFDQICYDLQLKDTGRHIETIYAKLFFGRIEKIDKIIYIDSDTIINGSLSEMWSTNLEGFYVGGVETYTVGVKKVLGLLKEDHFINDGVAIMNLKEIRNNSILPYFLDFIAQYNGEPPLLSEGTINVVCKGHLKILHPKFNLMSGFISYANDARYYSNSLLGKFYSTQTIKDALSKPIIIHYLEGFYNRPWSKYCTHPLQDRYLHYKNISPWKETELTSRKLPWKLRVIGAVVHKLPYRVFVLLRTLTSSS